jgi:hypothetical protein
MKWLLVFCDKVYNVNITSFAYGCFFSMIILSQQSNCFMYLWSTPSYSNRFLSRTVRMQSSLDMTYPGGRIYYCCALSCSTVNISYELEEKKLLVVNTVIRNCIKEYDNTSNGGPADKRKWRWRSHKLDTSTAVIQKT